MERGNVKEGLRLGWLLYMLFHMLIQLSGERLSEKVPATILRGVVGGFEFTVLQRNLKELAWKAVKMCLRVLKERTKVGSTATVVRNSVSIISQILLLFGIVVCTFFPTTFLEIAVYKLVWKHQGQLFPAPRNEHSK